MIYIKQSKTHYDVIEDDKIIKSFDIKPWECHNDCLGKLKALDIVKKMLGLPFIDHTKFIAVGKW